MAYIPQKQLEKLKKLLEPNKVIVILGPRRCGKTTLLNKFVEELSGRPIFVSGDDNAVRDILGSQSLVKIQNFIGDSKLLIVDEAQRIPFIGIGLKIAVDHIPEIKIVATGSSSFDLNRHLGEPLTGRKWTLPLYPISQLELSAQEHSAITASSLEDRLVYGSYPEIVTMPDNTKRKELLNEITSSYILKDILALEGIRRPEKLTQILKALAYQIGHDISLSEIGNLVSMDKHTVERYLYLLEECFVVYRVGGFSRNLRKEIKKTSRYFFFDNGIRNALIGNFNLLTFRDDIGMLWENYIMIERRKKMDYIGRQLLTRNFWRTYDQKEIDLVEEYDGILHGYEVSWNKPSRKPPADWFNAYPNAEFHVVTKHNYLEFIT